MPRILVADDNSNIQKMVTLALEGEGFEVISVGNGEAAVRKLPDVSPDLVLADIFMPVRSGYEVCEYIKRDPKFAHTPVVLLVGAFDPLDENEAQRVQADGVLKKPFVPPDPLINMVKTLVARSVGERLVPVTASVAASAEAEAPHAAASEGAAEEPEPVLEEFSDMPPEEFAAPEPAMHMEAQNNPLAFGSLLEAPPEELDSPAPEQGFQPAALVGADDDAVLTATRAPSLGEPAFWNPPAETEEPSGEEVVEDHAWNEGAWPARHDDSVSLEPIESGAESRDSAAETSEELPEVEAIEEPVPQPEPSEAPASWSDPPAAEAPVPSELAPVESGTDSDIGTAWELPDEIPAEPHPEQASAYDQAPVFDDPALDKTSSPTSPSPESLPASEPEPPTIPDPDLSEAESPVAEPDPELEWAAEPLSPAEGTLQDAPEQFPAAQAPVEEVPAVTATLPPAAEAPVEADADASGTALPEPVLEPEPLPADPALPAPEAHAGPATEDAPDAAVPPSPELIDAVVTRVLERIQPQVIEDVTREFLRPVLEALVRRELETRK